MGAELKERYDTSVELIGSSGGVFEVVVDGKQLFSKKKLGRFPEIGEIVHLIDLL
ncbi:MAG: Rdx family protein [Deltaproteobacteria bacterium]|nr:Rdx family protein [Deltaproteobacteria bacterium]